MEISKRCGKSRCQFYNKHDKISGCKIMNDRRECSISMNHREKVGNKSRLRVLQY